MPRLRRFVSPTDAPPADAEGRLERLREWLVGELVDTYRFPREWVGERIRPLGTPGAPAGSLFGVTVTLADGTPFLLAAVGHGPGAPVDALQAAMVRSEAVGLGLATDGDETVCLRRRFDAARCEIVGDLELHGRASPPTSEPAPLRLESLLAELHDRVRDIDGLHADEALDELCKVLRAKLYDERQAPRARWLAPGRHGTNEELAAAVRVRYRDASRGEPDGAPDGVTAGALRLSSPALGRLMESLAGRRLRDGDADLRGRAFQRIIAPAARAGLGQYLTPEGVVDLMVEVAAPAPGERIADPFCGSALLLSRCHAALATDDRAELIGLDKSERMVRIARTELGLSNARRVRVRCADALLSFANFPELRPASFDLIVTNPPFGALLGPESLSQLAPFELARDRPRVGLEVLGIERCLQLLRPGGRLVVVVPDGLLANASMAYARDWIARRAVVRAVVSLPIETFTPFGANINTSVLFLRKRRPGEVADGGPVCLVRVDAVGYDNAGRAAAPSELPACAATLRDFFAREGW